MAQGHDSASWQGMQWCGCLCHVLDLRLEFGVDMECEVVMVCDDRYVKLSLQQFRGRVQKNRCKGRGQTWASSRDKSRFPPTGDSSLGICLLGSLILVSEYETGARPVMDGLHRRNNCPHPG